MVWLQGILSLLLTFLCNSQMILLIMSTPLGVDILFLLFPPSAVELLLKSVQMKAKMNIKVKGVISINMFKRLMKVVHKYYNGVTYKALFLVAYFGFFD